MSRVNVNVLVFPEKPGNAKVTRNHPYRTTDIHICYVNTFNSFQGLVLAKRNTTSVANLRGQIKFQLLDDQQSVWQPGAHSFLLMSPILIFVSKLPPRKQSVNFHSVVLVESDMVRALAVNCWLTSATPVTLGQICWAWSWENTFKYLQKHIANLKPWKQNLCQFFFFKLHAQNIVEQHPFVISCSILVFARLVILIFFPCSLYQLNSENAFVPSSLFSICPRAPLHPRHWFGRQTVCVQQKQQQSRGLSWDELCSSLGEGCSLLTEGRKRQWEQKGGEGRKREKSDREGGNDN